MQFLFVGFTWLVAVGAAQSALLLVRDSCPWFMLYMFFASEHLDAM